MGFGEGRVPSQISSRLLSQGLVMATTKIRLDESRANLIAHGGHFASINSNTVERCL